MTTIFDSSFMSLPPTHNATTRVPHNSLTIYVYAPESVTTSAASKHLHVEKTMQGRRRRGIIEKTMQGRRGRGIIRQQHAATTAIIIRIIVVSCCCCCRCWGPSMIIAAPTASVDAQGLPDETIAAATTTTTATTATTTTPPPPPLEHYRDKESNNSNNSNNNNGDQDDDSHDNACGVYLAPSTLPGAGWGVFAAKHFRRGHTILPGDLIIPLQELAWHNGVSLDDEDVEPPNLWNNYHWNSRDFAGMELEGRVVTGVAFGYGALPNYHAVLMNMHESDFAFDRAAVRRDDPGAGAFSPFHDRAGVAKINVKPGMELFIEYGDEYFAEWRHDPEKPVVPLPHDYKFGNTLLKKFHVLIEKSLGFSKELLYDLLNGKRSVEDDNLLQTQEFIAIDDLLQFMDSMVPIWRHPPFATLPKDVRQLLVVLQKGLKMRDYSRSFRPVEELQSVGYCLDHIRPGLSTLPHAGRGAFAHHDIAVGELVAPVPLVHLANRTLYDMFDGREELDARGRPHWVRDTNLPRRHTQLMVNYCFGHEESTLLLCNYASGVSLINHASSKDGNANVRLQWSTALSRHPEWLEMPLEEWTSTEYAGLAMELIATRDIARDEEIFLDYGDAWTAAWQWHVDHWEAPPEASWYRPANELNADENLVVRTREEGGYGDFVKLYCIAETGDDENYEEEEIHVPCEVLDREWTPDGYRYMVTLHEEDDDADEDEREIWEGLPREAFVFEDKMYSRDHLQPWSFRHHLGVPDDLFPDAWRNLKEEDVCT